jgi:hypothetical protein
MMRMLFCRPCYFERRCGISRDVEEKKMKKYFTFALIAVLILAVSLSVGCRRHYNITGTWVFTIYVEGDVIDVVYTFVGGREYGEVIYEGQSLGEYTVSGDSVNITLQYYDVDDDYTIETYSGGFDNRNQMSGNFTIYIEGYGTFAGSWEAYR